MWKSRLSAWRSFGGFDEELDRSARARLDVSRRIRAAVLVILTGLFAVGAPQAEAQTDDPDATGHPVLTPSEPIVAETVGEVVLTLSMSRERPARVSYKTVDRRTDPKAETPGDYTAVSGEVLLAEGETLTIKIPIIDDDVYEGTEL